jgi:hypothetical protein
VGELVTAIHTFIDAHNADPKPFVCAALVESIVTGTAPNRVLAGVVAASSAFQSTPSMQSSKAPDRWPARPAWRGFLSLSSIGGTSYGAASCACACLGCCRCCGHSAGWLVVWSLPWRYISRPHIPCQRRFAGKCV